MSHTEPTLRIATTDEDRAAAYRLRYEVYVEGQGLFVEEADHENRWLRDDYDERSEIILAEDGGRCVGTSRMTFGSDTHFTEHSRLHYGFAHFEERLEESDYAAITRLMVLPEYRGGDLGVRLFAKSFELAAERGAELVLGACEIHLINYYWHLGFRPFGLLSNHSSTGALVRIAVVLGDLKHAQDLGNAPIAEALAKRSRSNENVSWILERIADSPALLSEARLGREAFQQKLRDQLGQTTMPELFAGLSAEQKARLLRKSHLMRFRQGDALYYDGHASRTLYVLLSGALDIEEPTTGRRRIEEPGSIVGEVALLASSRRLGDARAGLGGATVLALNDRVLRDILAERSALAAHFLLQAARGLSQKLATRTAPAISATQTMPAATRIAATRRRPRPARPHMHRRLSPAHPAAAASSRGSLRRRSSAALR